MILYTILTESHNIEIMIGNKTDETIDERFESFCKDIEKDLEEK